LQDIAALFSSVVREFMLKSLSQLMLFERVTATVNVGRTGLNA